MDKEKFSKEYRVSYQGVDESLTLSLPGLMGYIQETSILHGQAAGYPLEYFAKEKTGFVLVSWEIEALAYPKWDEKIVVETWPTSFKGIVGERSFFAKYPNGEPILKAESKWVYTNLETGKHQRISQEMAENYGHLFDRLLPENKAESTSNFQIFSMYEFSAKRSDIDSNNHVNNISYIKWAIDNIPDEVCHKYRPARITAKYTSPCALNDRVLVETHIQDDEKHTLSVVRNPEKPEQIHALINIRWN